MSDVVVIAQHASDETPGASRRSDRGTGRPGLVALMLLPGALIVVMGFNAGGYFPAAQAAVAIVISQILLVRIVGSSHPFEGLAPATLVAIGALAAYALLTLLSAVWSHSTSRALIEFDRAWLYLVTLLLFGSVRVGTRDLRWLVRGLAAASLIVCLAALTSRALPDVWHTAPSVSNARLSYPVTYWNALGLLAALGIVLAFHITCSLAERPSIRTIAAVGVPLLAATLFFTFSRGAIAAGAIGLAIYVIVARPRGLLSGALATIPASVLLVVIAYHANLLDTLDPTTSAAVTQGHRVAVAAGLCAAACAAARLMLAVKLDPLLISSSDRPRISRRARRTAIVGTSCVIVLAAIALSVPGSLEHDWQRFFSGVTPRGNRSDLRQRLTDPANNGRTDLWRVAQHEFSASPIHGDGAGTYQTLWDRNRPYFTYTINAHSLYLESMAELGVPGLALIVILVGAVLVGLRSRAVAHRRSLYGVLLAGAIIWALHAGVDWDWEMPVVTLGFFAAAGAALSPRKVSGRVWMPGHNSRMILGVLCLISVAAPLLIIGSQSRITDAEHALYGTHDCARARSAALSSIGWLDVRPEPYEVLGLCDVARGQPKLGISAMERAVNADPGSWETHYTLAIAQAAAGVDPRPTADRALRLNPLEPLTRQAVAAFRTSEPAEWVNRSAAVLAAALASNDLSIVPS